MKKYNRIWFGVTVASAALCLAACGDSAQTWNPSYVSLTPAPTEWTETGDHGNLESNGGSGAGSGAEGQENGTAGNGGAETPTQALPSPTQALPSPSPSPVPTPTVVPKTADDFNAADFFNGTVFAGDSVLSHFYWKVPVYDKETFGGSQFLVAVSYSVREALKPVSDTTIHPMYKGEQHQIWESMQMMDAKRVILFFGLNDIGVSGVDGFCENYATLMDRIREALPGVKLYVISTTPMRADMQGKGLNNPNIAEANQKMQEYCAENDVGYIDVASQLTDADGALREEYSDGTNVHQTKEAYLLWKDILVEYAKEELLAEYYEEAQGQ